MKRIVSGIMLTLLVIGMLTFALNSGAATGYGNSIGVLGDKALINPLPGQYANYSAKYYEDGMMVLSGWWNFSYLEYVEPDLINVTIELDTIGIGPEGIVYVYHEIRWLTINTTDRWVLDGTVEIHTWYQFWIETNVTEGSVIRLWRWNVTVMKSETIMVGERFVDCWVANYTDPTVGTVTWLFDKSIGLCAMVYWSAEYYGRFYEAVVTLVNTNIPIVAYSPLHELGISIEVPTTLQLNASAIINATVHNYGLSSETNIEVQLLIDGDVVNSSVVPLLESKSFAKLTYLWIPPAHGRYNVTACVCQVPEETFVENNRVTKFVRVSGPPEVGVEAGDWIKYDYNITGWPAGTPYPEWLKVEFLSVEETKATIRVTMRMSDGTQQNQTMTIDVVAGGQALGLSGFVIPANSKVGDSITMGGDGFTTNVTIDGETTRTYAGASRTVVYASFSLFGAQLTYYWDKQTGVMVESSGTYPQLNMTATAKATETNMWQGLYGDVNSDGVVDVRDIAIFGKAYGSYPGHARWNPAADLDGNGVINILDGVIIAKNFGKKW